MRKIILILAFCLYATSTLAGQREDMDLCAKKIKEKYKVDVIKKWYDKNENCQTNERDLIFSDGEVLYNCTINRKKNYISATALMKENSIEVYNIGDSFSVMDSDEVLKKRPKGRCGLISETYYLSENNVISKDLFKKQQQNEAQREKKEIERTKYEALKMCQKVLKEKGENDIIFYDINNITENEKYQNYFNIGEQPVTFLGLEIGHRTALCKTKRYMNGRYAKEIKVLFLDTMGDFQSKSYEYKW